MKENQILVNFLVKPGHPTLHALGLFVEIPNFSSNYIMCIHYTFIFCFSKMGQKVAWILFFLQLRLSSATYPEYIIPLSEQTNLKTCPFPMPDAIEPCSCKVDENYQLLLLCNIEKNMDEHLLQRLISAFACKKEVYLFDVNLNGIDWTANFSHEMFGQFKITHFHLSSFISISVNIQAGAFNASTNSLKTFHIETSEDKNDDRIVESLAFSNLHALNTVSLGNTFGTIKNKAFFNLLNLQQFNVDAQSLTSIESEVFYNLPKLKILDLSNQTLTSHPFLIEPFVILPI